MKILHPTDFSRTAENARLLALDLGQRFAAELVIVHVRAHVEEMPEPYPFALVGSERLAAELHQRLAEAQASEAERLREHLAALTPEGGKYHLLWGRPLPELLAILPDYDLVVMGAHGANRLDNYFLGGVAGRLVRRSPVPVLTVREECEHKQVNRVLVATDFSEASKHAWQFCLRLAEAGVRLAVGHVIEGRRSDLAHTQEVVARLEEIAEGAPARHVIREGDPVRVLPQLAEEVGAEVIAVGVRHQLSAAGLRFGSRADALLRSSPVPILSVPLVRS